ncbi:MAG TPA: hypothetical protein EYQ63_12180 [Fuerstia sp.]|nr:hypothetical protein [Fuerstiella sp.]
MAVVRLRLAKDLVFPQIPELTGPMSPSSPNRLNSLSELLNAAEPSNAGEDDAADSPEADAISPEEEAALRAEKLRTIQEAVDRGTYDSDDLLDEAMRRMRNAIENDNQSQ